GGTGVSVAGGSASGAAQVPLTTTQPGSLVYAVGNDWDSATARVTGTSQSIVQQWLDPSPNDTFWVQRSSPVPAAATTLSVGATSPTADRWNLAAVEVVRAG